MPEVREGQTKTLDPVVDKASKWVASRKGQKTLRESHERSQKLAEELAKESKIDPKTLGEPFSY